MADDTDTAQAEGPDQAPVAPVIPLRPPAPTAPAETAAPTASADASTASQGGGSGPSGAPGSPAPALAEVFLAGPFTTTCFRVALIEPDMPAVDITAAGALVPADRVNEIVAAGAISGVQIERR